MNRLKDALLSEMTKQDGKIHEVCVSVKDGPMIMIPNQPILWLDEEIHNANGDFYFYRSRELQFTLANQPKREVHHESTLK